MLGDFVGDYMESAGSVTERKCHQENTTEIKYVRNVAGT